MSCWIPTFTFLRWRISSRFKSMWIYRLYTAFNGWLLTRAARCTPVVVGEWCIANRKAQDLFGTPGKEKECRKIFRQVYDMQLKFWNKSAGQIYWNYQLLRDRSVPLDEVWKKRMGLEPLLGKWVDRQVTVHQLVYGTIYEAKAERNSFRFPLLTGTSTLPTRTASFLISRTYRRLTRKLLEDLAKP